MSLTRVDSLARFRDHGKIFLIAYYLANPIKIGNHVGMSPNIKDWNRISFSSHFSNIELGLSVLFTCGSCALVRSIDRVHFTDAMQILA